MKFERFSELWDALVTHKPNVGEPSHNMSPTCLHALIEYGQGNKTKINEIRKMLGREPIGV